MTKRTQILTSPRLVVKPLALKHLSERYVSWLNDEEVIRYLESGGNYTLAMLRGYLAEVEKNNPLFWAIHLRDSDEHIGNIKIDPINIKYEVGEYGILIGDKTTWGQGFAFEASKLVIDYCFSEKVNLRKITLGVVAENFPAIKLYEQLGFLREGILKKEVFHDGKYCDVYRYGLFNVKHTSYEP